MIRTLGVAALLAVAGCSVPGTGAPKGPVAEPGSVVPAEFGSEMSGHPVSVVVPRLRYNLVVTDPVEAIDGETVAALVEPVAPDGHRFIGVGWEPEIAPGDGWSAAGHKDVDPHATLVVDGVDHDLGALNDREGLDGGWATVPEDAEEVRLEVEYDGLVQTIDPYAAGSRADGPALLYASAPSFATLPCPAQLDRRADDRESWSGGGCHARAVTPLPWHADLGWAPDGRAWLLVTVSIERAYAGYDTRPYTEYDVAPREPQVRLDGVPATHTLPATPGDAVGEQSDGTWRATVVFEVGDDFSGGELALDRVFEAVAKDVAEARSQGAPAELRRTLRTRAQLPGA